MQKEKEIERKKENETENKKLTEIYAFIKSLKHEKYKEKGFNKEIILFFGVSDFRVIAGKTKLMETLDLIRIETVGWGEKEIWINESTSKK